MKKLVITGCSGFMGYHLGRVASSKFEVYGLYHEHDFTSGEVTPVKCDITNYLELGNVMEDINPDCVIHAAAIADVNYCQQNKEQSEAVNVDAAVNLAGIASDFQIPFLFTSTDLVFDGKKGNYDEGDKKNPLSLYGEQKSTAEEEVLKIYPMATLTRLPLMFGAKEASNTNFFQKFLADTREGKSSKLFFDEYRSVCGARSISEGLVLLLGLSDLPQIIHLAGRERISRYDFGIKAVKTFGLNQENIQRCSQKDVTMSAPRPADVSLNIDKALALGYSPLTLDEELQLIFAQQYLS